MDMVKPESLHVGAAVSPGAALDFSTLMLLVTARQAASPTVRALNSAQAATQPDDESAPGRIDFFAGRAPAVAGGGFISTIVNGKDHENV